MGATTRAGQLTGPLRDRFGIPVSYTHLPYKVIEQMLHHPLTDAGIEKFKADYTKVFGA